MKTTTTRCDRCRTVIHADGTVIEATAGGLRRRRGPLALDLCQGCTDRFVEWLDALAGEPAPVEAPTVPA